MLQAPRVLAVTFLTTPFHVTRTATPASAVPLTVILPGRSVALITLSPATVEITGVPGTTVSMRISCFATSLILPAWSVDCAVTEVKAVSAGISAVGKLTTQTPDWLVVAFREIPPNVTTTLAPGSAWPVTVTFANFSAALMTLSPATDNVRFWFTVSMVKIRVAGSLILPEESVAIAVTFTVPSIGICAAVNDELHEPFAAVLIVRLIVPKVSSIDAFGSAVPRKVTPSCFSAALMMLSVATG